MKKLHDRNSLLVIKNTFKFILKYSLIIALLLQFSYSQSIDYRIVKGHVFELSQNGSKSPLVKARVLSLSLTPEEKSILVGAMTDADGSFSIKLPKNVHHIVASYLGYKTDTVKVEDETKDIIITLTPLLSKTVLVSEDAPAQMINEAAIIRSEIITRTGLKKAACCNLSESFETNPTVDVNFTDAFTGAKQIQLLGLSGEYVQILTEKIPSVRGLGLPFGLNYIPGTWMNSIQISKGASIVNSGAQSMTGLINIEYKKPEELNPPLLSFYINQNGRSEVNFDISEEVGKDIYTMLFFHGSLFNSLVDKNNDGFLDMPKTKQVDIFNRWKMTLGKIETQIGAKFIYEKREAGQIDYFDKNDLSKYFINIDTKRYELFTKTGTLLETDNYQSIGLILSFIGHEQNSNFGSKVYNAKQNSFYSNLLYDINSNNDKIKINSGLSYQYDSYNEKLTDTSWVRNESIPGAFLATDIKLINSLDLSAGIRDDYHNLFGNFLAPRLNFKYQIDTNLALRGSAGKGWRVPNIIAENQSLLISNRQIIWNKELKPEISWNYGFNLSYKIFTSFSEVRLSVDYFRTNFVNQLLIDRDLSSTSVTIFNFDGLSYSNSVQFDIFFEPIKRLEINLAYKFNDVKADYGGKLQTKPLISRDKYFANFGYTTNKKDWKFDFTIVYNGSGRIPSTMENPMQYMVDENFKGYFILNTQITYKFDSWEIYLGGENLTNFMQDMPIIAYDDTKSKYFDGSLIWGPLMGRIIYSGFRYEF